MELFQVIAQLHQVDDNSIIYAEKNPNWHIHSHAHILAAQECGVFPPNVVYMLEVSIAKEVIEVWKMWHKREPSLEEKTEAIIYYSEHDAYMP